MTKSPPTAALIGLGMVSATYGDALTKLAPDVALAGVYARTPGSRTAFAAKHPDLEGADRAYDSLDAIAADDSVDFVIVTTPPDARRQILRIMAAAGKHVLMEKPVERSVAGAVALCEIAEDAGVSLGIVLQHRARPAAKSLMTIIEAGDLGDLLAVEVAVPWWRTQGYYDAPGRGTYARDGGGVLISQAIHTLDLMLALTGPVAEVTAMTATTSFHKIEVEDFVSAGLRFANGAVGTLFASTASYPGRAEGIVLHYRHGTAQLTSNELTVHWQDGRIDTDGEATATGAGADPMAFTSDWHQAVIADFAKAITTGQPPMVPGRTALGVHRLIAGLEQSGRDKASVTLEN